MYFRYDYVVSLGPDCQAATQSKKFFPRAQCETVPMSYQVTPIKAIVAYFERDFRGMFERDDLQIGQNGGARNLRYGTQHPYEFPNGAASYSDARARHDYLCSKMRTILASGKCVLFLLGSDRRDELDKIEDAIRTHYPNLEFRIVAARSPRPNTVWSHVRLPEWEAASSAAKKKWSHSGLVFGLKIQSQRLAHHIRALRF
jgi:hypothetical protein